MKAELGLEHCFSQVEIKVRCEQVQDLKCGRVVHFARDPFAVVAQAFGQAGENIQLGAFAVDLDQVGFRNAQIFKQRSGFADFDSRRILRVAFSCAPA